MNLSELEIGMVRPRVASLNSLGNILREARPLHTKCRLSLNYPDETNGMVRSALIKRIRHRSRLAARYKRTALLLGDARHSQLAVLAIAFVKVS